VGAIFGSRSVAEPGGMADSIAIGNRSYDVDRVA
jgi:hypothetical protein